LDTIERMPDADTATPARELVIRGAMIALLVGVSFLVLLLA